MANFNTPVPLFIKTRFFEPQNGNHNSSYKRYGEQSQFSSNNASELFKLASKCLLKAKQDISEYLHKTSNLQGDQSKSRQTPDCNEHYLLIILVTTRPGNFANRVAIRLSWGRMDSVINSYIKKNNIDYKWKSIFSVGLANSPNIGSLVALESERYKDILRLPYKDTYKNLPNKTMNSLEWIAENCQARFVLKTDDDCFVNIFKVLPWLQNLPSHHRYIGRVNNEMPVIRDPKHRNYVSVAEHKDNYYKPYCAGGGYILRSSIIRNVTTMGKKIKQIINEDAYMGMLTNALGVSPKNEERFLPYIFFGPPVKKLHICDWKDQFLIHNVFGKRQIIMHYNSIAMKYFHSLCEKF